MVKIGEVGRIRTALAAIEAARRSPSEEQHALDALDRLTRLTDSMIGEFEELNLRGVQQAPDHWQLRLAGLLSSLPFEYSWNVGAHPTPSEVLDVLFEMQQKLFDHKNAILNGGRLTNGRRPR